MLNKLIILGFMVFLIIGTAIGINHKSTLPKQTPDEYVRDRIVLLKSPTGTCSGVEVVAQSGKVYTLTAGHCASLLDRNGKVVAKLENGQEYTIKSISLDKNADLLLLEGCVRSGLEVAPIKPALHDHIHTMSHGLGFPTYRTDGEVLDEKPILNLFAKAFKEVFTSAYVVPGSSGGAFLNDKDQLVGIVSLSLGNTIFSAMVRLQDIKDFLKGR